MGSAHSQKRMDSTIITSVASVATIVSTILTLVLFVQRRRRQRLREEKQQIQRAQIAVELEWKRIEADKKRADEAWAKIAQEESRLAKMRNRLRNKSKTSS